MLRATIAFVLIAGATGASAQVAGGSFISLDGAIEHRFEQSGDYLGKLHGSQEAVEAGVYREQVGICWVDRADGSKLEGNVMLYIGEVQCCLSVQPISDKLAFSQLWLTGTGYGYGMCGNQVFQRMAQ